MGNCSSKPNSGGPGPLRGGIGRKASGKKRKLTETGIMDENAPETTAPKIDMKRPDMQRLLERLLDMFRGEIYLVNERIPSSRSDIRWYLHTQVIAAVRDVVHRLNESCDLETDRPMPPSQVIDILNEVRTTLNETEGYDLPAVTIRNANVVKAFQERIPFLESWLLISSMTQETVMNRQELSTYCDKVSLSFPHSLLEGTTFSYSQIVRMQHEYSKELLSDIYEIYNKFAPKGFMTVANFATFGGKKKDLTQILAGQGLLKIQYEVFSVREFILYYCSVEHNSGIEESSVSHDMNQPISSYMISGSSNSWLALPDVVTSDSSVDQLKHILLAGTRYLELECNDGPEGSPTVRLSWTKNKSLPLDKCLECINQYAFETTPFPIIISIAFHYGLESDGSAQMQTTADLINGIFKEKLALWGPDREPPSLDTVTPETYKNKIFLLCEKRPQEIGPIARTSLRNHGGGPTELGLGLVNLQNKRGVKVKAVAEGSAGHKAGIIEGTYIEKIDGSNGTESITSVDDLLTALQSYRAGDEIKLMVDQKYLSICLGGTNTNTAVRQTEAQRALSFGYDSSDEEKPEPILKMKCESLFAREKKGHRYKRIPISEDLSTVAFMRRERVTSPDLENELVAVTPPWWEVCVVPVDLVDAVCIDEILKTAIVCIIPSKDSLKSQNYDPYWLWERGVQITSLNHHNTDTNMRIQQARFTDNGGCGYLLKDSVRQEVSLSVVVRFMYNPPELMFRSGSGSVRNFVLRTRLSSQRSEDAAATPPSPSLSWDHEVKLYGSNRSLEVLVISVLESDDIILECTAPVTLLKEGVHALPLQNPETGEIVAASSLICDISFQEKQ
eukprot:TRINITY_DN1023_c0_g1_i12.p1 TRINITY_DN1023_c0_g1~~TRINITY_DN1023_c0_g1_i12.p1  ORF type:complete len:845 (+),score=140.28 TRINITY_DN1023_c0_g1_i12:101-2635(+)